MGQSRKLNTQPRSRSPLVQLAGIRKSFDGKTVISDLNLTINNGEFLTLLGPSGCGKTTVLRLIAGLESVDSGQIHLEDHDITHIPAENRHVNTVFQSYALFPHMTVFENVAFGLRMQKTPTADIAPRVHDALRMVQLEAFAQRKPHQLSGGQQQRTAIGRAIIKNPDILLLDEPTNHLDVDSIRWLENYLSHYKGAVIIVSHDRYFLDKIVNKVMEIDQGHSMLFDGNYTTFIEKRDQIKAIRLKEYKNQQQEIKHQQEVIKKLKQFNREKSIKRAESREKALNKIDVLEKPTEYNADMRLSIEPEIISGNDVLTLKDVSKSFGNKSLFHGLSADIFREERVALIGPNGTGKTTLLKIICKKISNNGGTISLGAGVSIGYYDQAQDNLDDSKTIFDEISDAYPDLNNTKIRNTLAAFLFYGEDVFRPISSLSGGEKGRVSLAKLMLSHANFLILDEPTNHLDIQSKEILESAMNAYTGTILYVSHDRYFINKTATRILEISDHGLTSYPGNYQDYIAQKEKEKASLTSSTASSVSVDTESKLDWKQQKEEQAKQRKKENRLKKVEEQITELETKQEELSEAMSLPENASDPAKLMELSNEQASIASSLEELYEEWETLC